MDVQRIGEQRYGFVCLTEHSLGGLFLVVGITTLDNGGPREVIAIGKQIFIDVNSSLMIISSKRDLT